MRTANSWTWTHLLGLLACGPVAPVIDEPAPSSTTSGVSPTTGVGEGTAAVSSGEVMVSTTSSPGESTAAGTGGSDDGSSTSSIVDLPGDFWCNYLTQDCPPGKKCIPYSDNGGSGWNNNKCVPVMENPAQLDESCFTVGGGNSGIDNCDLGLMCWEVNAEGDGTCVALCKSDNGDVYCDHPGTFCAYNGETLGLCFPGCDPLTQDCDLVDTCIRNPQGQGYLCVPDASGDEGQQHDPCEFANACDPGFVCAEVTAAVVCDLNATGCCQPFCDLTDPDADAKCGGVGQVCTSFDADSRLPEYEHVGYCAVPE